MNRMMVLPVLLPLLLAAACGSDDGGDGSDDQEPAAEGPPRATALWVASLSADEVYRLDLETNELQSASAVDSAATLAVTSDAAWIDGYDGVRIGDDLVVEDLDLEDSLGDSVDSVGASEDQVWFAVDDPAAAVVPYDPASGELGERIELGIEDFSPDQIIVTDGALYLVNGWDSSLVKVDTESGDVAVVENESVSPDIALIGDSLWVAGYTSVMEIDADSFELVEQYPAEDVTAWTIAGDEESGVWVGTQESTVARLDTDSGTLTTELELPEVDDIVGIDKIRIVNGELWIVRPTDELLRYDIESLELLETFSLTEPSESYVLEVEY